VYTTVRAVKASRRRVRIRINGKPAEAEVSRAVLKAFKGIASEAYDLSIDHKVEVPIGAGYGASGAGALSLALALNDALKLGLSYIEAAQVAHLAEVRCKTGLGTVLAETAGGVEMRVKPGAPGIGKVRKIPVRPGSRVVSVYLGQLYTRPFLEDVKIGRRVSGIGGSLLEELTRNPTLTNFLVSSKKFSERLNIYTPRIREILDELERRQLGVFGMNMFCEALFTVVEAEGLEESLRGLEEVQLSPKQVIVSDIDREGARLVG